MIQSQRKILSFHLLLVLFSLLFLAPSIDAIEEVPILTVVEGNTSFAVDLYHELTNEEGNLFFSPYSIYNALVMVSEGARREYCPRNG
jgi:serpin B